MQGPEDIRAAFTRLAGCQDAEAAVEILTNLEHILHFQPNDVIEDLLGSGDVIDTLVNLMRQFQEQSAALLCRAGQVLHVLAMMRPTVAQAMADSGVTDFLWLLLVEYQTQSETVPVGRMCVTLLHDLSEKCHVEGHLDGLSCVAALMQTAAEDPKFIQPCCLFLAQLCENGDPQQAVMAQTGIPAALCAVLHGSWHPDTFHAGCAAVAKFTEEACLKQLRGPCVGWFAKLILDGIASNSMEPDVLESSCAALQAFAASEHCRHDLEQYDLAGPLLSYSESFKDDDGCCIAIFRLLDAFTMDNPPIQKKIRHAQDQTAIIIDTFEHCKNQTLYMCATRLLRNVHPHGMSRMTRNTIELVQNWDDMSKALGEANAQVRRLKSDLNTKAQTIASLESQAEADQETADAQAEELEVLTAKVAELEKAGGAGAQGTDPVDEDADVDFGGVETAHLISALEEYQFQMKGSHSAAAGALITRFLDVQQDLSQWQRTVTELQEALVKSKADSTADAAAVDAVNAQSKVATLEAEVERLQSVVEGKEQQLLEMVKANSKLEHESNGLKALTAERSAEGESLREATEQRNRDLDLSRAEVASLQTQNGALQTELEGLRADHTQLNADFTGLSVQHTQLSAELTQLKAEHEAVTGEHSGLGAENAKLAAENTQIRADHADLTARNAQLADENAKLNAEHSEKAAGHEHLGAENTRLTAENTQLTADHTQLTAELTQLTADHAKLTAEHRSLAAEHAALTESHTKLQDTASVQAAAHAEELAKASDNTALQELQADTEALRVQLTTLQSDYQEQAEELRQRKQDIAGRDHQIEQLQAELAVITEAREERDGEVEAEKMARELAEAEHVETQDKLATAEESLRGATQQVAELQEELAAVKTEHQQGSQVLMQRQKELDQLQNQLEKVEQDAQAAAQAAAAERKSAQDQISELVVEGQKRADELKAVQALCTAAAAECDSLKRALAAAEEAQAEAAQRHEEALNRVSVETKGAEEQAAQLLARAEAAEAQVLQVKAEAEAAQVAKKAEAAELDAARERQAVTIAAQAQDLQLLQKAQEEWLAEAELYKALQSAHALATAQLQEAKEGIAGLKGKLQNLRTVYEEVKAAGEELERKLGQREEEQRKVDADLLAAQTASADRLKQLTETTEALQETKAQVAALTTNKMELEATLSCTKEELEAKLAHTKQGLEGALASAKAEGEAVLARTKEELEAVRAELEQLRVEHADVSQQLADTALQLQEEQTRVRQLQQDLQAAKEDAAAGLARGREEWKEMEQHLRSQVQAERTKHDKLEDQMSKLHDLMQDKDRLVVSYENWGHKSHKKLLEEFDYREIACRVGIRQEESFQAMWLSEWTGWELQTLRLRAREQALMGQLDEMRQQLLSESATVGRVQQQQEQEQASEAAALQARMRHAEEEAAELRDRLAQAEAETQRWQAEAGRRSEASRERSFGSAASLLREREAEVTPPLGRLGSMRLQEPSGRLRLQDERDAQARAREAASHYLEANGLAERKSLTPSTMEKGLPLVVEEGPPGGEAPCNPPELLVGKLGMDYAALQWAPPGDGGPGPVYRVLLSADAGEQYSVAVDTADCHCVLRGLRARHVYHVTVRALVKYSAAPPPRLQCVVSFRTRDGPEPSDKDTVLSRRHVPEAEVPGPARPGPLPAHPPGLAVQNLSSTGCTLQWDLPPASAAPAPRFCVWLSRDCGHSFAACALTEQDHAALRDLQPGLAFEAHVTTIPPEPAAAWEFRGPGMAFTTHPTGMDPALPPPKAGPRLRPRSAQRLTDSDVLQQQEFWTVSSLATSLKTVPDAVTPRSGAKARKGGLAGLTCRTSPSPKGAAAQAHRSAMRNYSPSNINRYDPAPEQSTDTPPLRLGNCVSQTSFDDSFFTSG